MQENDYRTYGFLLQKHIQGGPRKNNTESMSNIHNKLSTCISSKCNNYWTNITIYFIYQQLLALIIIYSVSLHSIQFVPKMSLVSVSFCLVSVLFFLGHPVWHVRLHTNILYRYMICVVWVLLSCMIIAKLYDYCCMNVVVWLLLYEFCCMTIVVWMLLYDYCCMNFVVWLLLYEFCCMIIVVWLLLYDVLYDYCIVV